MLGDIAMLTGAQVISEEVGLKLESATLDLLGRARRVVVTKDDTTIVDGGGDEAEVKGRIAQIKREIEDTDSDWDREKLQERLAKLAGGVAVVQGRRGHRDRAQGEEAPHRGRAVRDAGGDRRGHRRRWRHRAAPQPRGGRRSSPTSSTATRRPVRRSSRKALEEPLKWIAINAGLEGAVIVQEVEPARARSGSTR